MTSSIQLKGRIPFLNFNELREISQTKIVLSKFVDKVFLIGQHLKRFLWHIF